MQMKKRVLSVLLALCLAGSLASTAWAAGDTAGATPSPAPVTQELDENAGEPAELNDELNENDEDLENTDLTDETLDDATEDAPDSDSTGVPEEGNPSDNDGTPAEDGESDEDSTAANDESSSAPADEDDNIADEPADADGTSEDVAGPVALAETRATKNSFHITWEKYFDVTVKYVDQNGNLLDHNFDCLDQTLSSGMLTFADYAPVTFDVENGTYRFDSAHYNGVDGSTVTTLSASSSSEWWNNVNYFRFDNGESLRYQTEGWGKDNYTKEATVYMVYSFTEAEPEPQDLYISDTVAENGLFTATFQDGILSGNEEITYTWYRRLSNEGDWEPVTSQKVTGDHYNWDTNTPQQINVAYDALLKGAEDAQRYYYKVEATVKSADGTIQQYTATKQVPYYIQLQNGSFETPDVPENQFNMQWPNGTANLIWQTTGPGAINNKPGQDIEVIEEGHDGTEDNYGVNVASDGEQFAELNCEAYGALYQDVMTIPGSTLNWSFDHLARDLDEQSQHAEDTMALVIMPASEADAVAQQLSEAAESSDPASEIRAILNQLKNNGYFVEEVTDSTYTVEDDWQTHEGTYEVPDGQYLTRFFFVSVEADYDKRENASHFGTVGNLLDDVWFSTQVKPAADDEAKLIVSKTVTGLTSIDGYSVTMTVNDGNTSQDIVLNNFVSDGNGNYTASKSITYSVPANGGSKTLTVTESAPNVTGYTLDSTAYEVTEEGNILQTGSGTTVNNIVVNAARTKTVAFTNTYVADKPPEAPAHNKQAVLIDNPEDPNYGDGYNYKLSLDVIGDTNTQTMTSDLNVLMIIDRSASMKNWIESVKSAANSLIETLEDNADIGTITYDIITFNNAGSDNTKTELSWKDGTARNAIVAINKISIPWSAGTNWEAAITEAIADLNSTDKPSNAKDCVIFFTDGEPTSHIGSYGNDVYDDSPGAIQGHVNEAVDAVKKLNADYFFGIGAFSNGNSTNRGYLEQVVNAANAGTHKIVTVSKPEDLNDAFNTIASSITTGYYDVTISDTLSEYADFVLGSDGKPQFTIEITKPGTTDADGDGEKDPVIVTDEDVAPSNDIYSTDHDIYVSRDGDTFGLEFADGYMLKDGYTYTLSVIITPSDTAKTEYATTGEYPDTPDPGTGTHAGDKENGFYSNAEGKATLSYKHSSWNETLTDEYLRPVVQVPEVGDLVINKEVTGTTVSNATYYFEIETKLNMADASPKINGTAVSFTETEEGDSWKATVELQATTNNNGVDGTITITGLPIGSYTVTEKTDDASLPTVANYHWVDVAYNGDSSKDQAEVTVGSDTEKPATVAVTNNYEHDDVTLTVTKTVGGNMGDTTKDFTFTLTVTSAQGKTLDYSAIAETITVTPLDKGETDETYSFNDTSVSFEMHSGQQMKVTLPYGCSYFVSENAEGYSFQVTVTGDNDATKEGVNVSGTMDNNITVAYTNTMVVEVPTGLNRNGTPYTLMVTAAGIAGLALIGGIVAARRRRRRME